MTKCETHKLRKRKEGTRLPYVCLECGKEFKLLTGILVARNIKEEDDYFKRRRELFLKLGM
jgi:DNA-directed RNA polymerase subunit RPC12/RpoP